MQERKIVLFGAGKSASVLINYLLKNAEVENWRLILVDVDEKLAQKKLNSATRGTAIGMDIKDETKRSAIIADADLVISMLPPALHILVAKDCIIHQKNLLTASYADQEIKKLEKEIEEKNILFLCEMGLDPGIDHMSAMQLIDEIHSKGGEICSFQSHCGGLVAPESDDNPWHYKISWNPRNIVLAGKSGARYKKDDQEYFLAYEHLFDPKNLVKVKSDEYGWYANRDSLSYIPLYGLNQASEFIRTTLRHPDFMYGWQQIIKLQLTDETPVYESDNKTLQEVYDQHFEKHGLKTWRKDLLKEDDEETNAVNNPAQTPLLKELLLCLGINDDITKINKGKISAADLLQFSLEHKLALRPEDKDMIVMLHEIDYSLNDQIHQVKSSLIVKGENNTDTAMAKTVGLPLGIAAKLILNGTLTLKGLQVPVSREIYDPVLKELSELGIRFEEMKI